jgi:signal transduction histidine kinase
VGGLRLHYRIVLPLIVVALVAIGSAAWITFSVATGALQSRVQAQLVSAAAAVARADLALTPAILRTLRDIVGADVITFDADGRVVASSLAGDSSPLLQAASRERPSYPFDEQPPPVLVRECGVPCLITFRRLDGRPGLTVALVAQTSELAVATRTIARALLLTAVLSVVVMVLVSQAVVRRLTAPLDRLVRFAREVSPDDVHRRAEVGDDEVGVLAEAFNEMLGRLGRSREALVRSEKLALAGLFAARVAHDIRNPLSSIKMQAQLLHAEPRDSADRKALAAMLRDIAQVESVIRDLMELARPSELRREPGSLNAVIKEAIDQMAPQLAHRKIATELRLDDLPSVPVDAPRLKQAMLNVLANASEAMPTGGTLMVKTQAEPSFAVIEVCDDGVGVDAAFAERAFDPFVTTKPDGVGLGLVNVRAVVEGHGGRIRMEPRPGKGTRVLIHLPLERGAGDAAGVPSHG